MDDQSFLVLEYKLNSRHSYFILGYDTTLVVLSLRQTSVQGSREKNSCITKTTTTTTTTPTCMLELVTVTDKILISQNSNSPSLDVIYVHQSLNETG